MLIHEFGGSRYLQLESVREKSLGPDGMRYLEMTRQLLRLIFTTPAYGRYGQFVDDVHQVFNPDHSLGELVSPEDRPDLEAALARIQNAYKRARAGHMERIEKLLSALPAPFTLGKFAVDNADSTDIWKQPFAQGLQLVHQVVALAGIAISGEAAFTDTFGGIVVPSPMRPHEATPLLHADVLLADMRTN